MKKITQTLILISIIATIFDVARLDVWGTTNLLYLIWNLFLAWIPYVISSYCFKKDTSINNFVPFFILWLLFFPNAPYVVTDSIHIVLSSSSLIWYDSLLFFLFGWIGLFLGMLSLFHVHKYLQIHLSHLISEISIFAICFISSFGIYLGRFERWNSWDVFINPLRLLRYSLSISTTTVHSASPLLFMSVFSIIMYAVYKVIYVLLEYKFE